MIGGAIAVRAGRIIDPHGLDVLHDHTILVDGESVEAVVPSSSYGTGDGRPVLDATSKTVIPGLIDAHVHISYDPDPYWPWRQQDLHASVAYLALQGSAFARRTLESGFTTIRDLGARGHANLAVRDAIERGVVNGSRVLACGLPLCSTGGHFDEAVGNPDVDVPGRADVVDSPDQARRAVRRQLKHGADLIKIAVDGRVGSSFDPSSTEWQELSGSELVSICDAAHEAGRPVAAHTGGGRGLIEAIEAGIDSLEHLQGFEDSVLDKLAERGTFLVPTLMATRCTVDAGTAPQAPASMQERALEWMARNWDEKLEAMGRVRTHGVRIALGTDAGYVHCRHGDNGYELQLLVEAGLPPLEALRSATSEAADCLQWGDRIGRLAPGYVADLVVLDGDPLDDISILRGGNAVELVMKAGAVVHRRTGRKEGSS